MEDFFQSRCVRGFEEAVGVRETGGFEGGAVHCWGFGLGDGVAEEVELEGGDGSVEG